MKVAGDESQFYESFVDEASPNRMSGSQMVLNYLHGSVPSHTRAVSSHLEHYSSSGRNFVT